MKVNLNIRQKDKLSDILISVAQILIASFIIHFFLTTVEKPLLFLVLFGIIFTTVFLISSIYFKKAKTTPTLRRGG